LVQVLFYNLLKVFDMRITLILFTFILSFYSCQKNSITGRSQLILIDEGDLQQMSSTEYKTFLTKNKVVSTGSTRDQEMVARVGKRIANAVAVFAAEQGKSDLLKGYEWEFNLVDSKEVNAWCMPGGKVVVYTGLLPVSQNEVGLAIVMGHEIAHAVAKHGNERMSQGLMQQMGGMAISVAVANKPAETQAIFMEAYGIGSAMGGTLPFSRKHELEADRYGLIFAAKAGYDPREAVAFWERMAKMATGQKPPEILSTHPSDETRIEKVKIYVQEAMKYYKPVNQSTK
jgi:predicted Zn-dependent protease